jgi:hypothetical protein
VEALAIETGPLGIDTALLEPGAVSSGALDDVTAYTLPDDPYAHLLGRGGPRADMMTPQEVAAGIADAAEAPVIPLRIPLGRSAIENPGPAPGRTRQPALHPRPARPANPAART